MHLGKIKIFLLLFCSIVLQASEQDRQSAVEQIRQEVSKLVFERDYRIFLNYKEMLSELDYYEEKAYSKDSTRFEILDKLLDIQQNSKSIIIAQYQLNKTLKYISMKNIEKFNKYAKSSIELLYEERLCDGFLFKGHYFDKEKGRKIEALRIYEQGVKVCKIKWKVSILMSRVSKVKYRLGIIGK